MKEAFINHTISFITNNNDNLSALEKEKLAYGLEGIYLTITKTVIILLIALVLGFVKEFIISLILFNIIRYPGFGFHAGKSIVCLISSTILILGLPYLLINIDLNLTIKIILCCVAVLAFIIWAPADTKKRPLTNKKKRLIRKIATIVIAVIYSIAIIMLNENVISDLFLAALLIEAILVSPFMYNFFNESYNNYKKV